MCGIEYKGIRFNDHTMPLSVEDEDFNSRDLTTFLVVQLYCKNAGIPSFFSRNMNVAIDSAESVEKVVDPESAVRIVRKTLSGFGTFHISEVLPLYELKLEDNSDAPGADNRFGYRTGWLRRKSEKMFLFLVDI